MEKKNKRIHGFTNDALGTFDAYDIRCLLKSGELNHKEIIEATIARANDINPTLNAIAFENYSSAMNSLKDDQHGFFSGVPLFFKDLTTLAGLPTTYGSEACIGAKVGTKNDPAAKQVLSMGFVNMGMSTMPEFGLMCSTEFPNAKNTLNPWNPAFSAGGSSGGAAALVASGVVPIAHAADGGGSTRIPSSCCGLVGLKPSRGRLLKSKVFNTQLVDICTDGVVSRSVRDTAHFYHEAENYYYNKKLPKMGLVTEPANKQLRIGYVEVQHAKVPIDAATQRVLNETVQLLTDLGHTLVPIELPITDQLIDDFTLLWSYNAYGVKRLGKLLFPAPFQPKQLNELTLGLSKFFAKQAYKAPIIRRRLLKTYSTHHNFLQTKHIDVILTPTVSHLTPPIGHFDPNVEYDVLMERMSAWVHYTPYANVTGCPSISLPIGHDDENDLPIGMTLNADHGEDALLLNLSYQIEQAQPWRRIYDAF